MVREYVYVKDVIDSYIELAENIDKTKGEAFNIASKNVFDVINIVQEISRILGEHVDFEILDQAKAEIPEQYLDGSKIKNLLGWEPKISFEDAIKGTFKWYEKFLS